MKVETCQRLDILFTLLQIAGFALLLSILSVVLLPVVELEKISEDTLILLKATVHFYNVLGINVENNEKALLTCSKQTLRVIRHHLCMLIRRIKMPLQQLTSVTLSLEIPFELVFCNNVLSGKFIKQILLNQPLSCFQ